MKKILISSLLGIALFGLAGCENKVSSECKAAVDEFGEAILQSDMKRKKEILHPIAIFAKKKNFFIENYDNVYCGFASTLVDVADTFSDARKANIMDIFYNNEKKLLQAVDAEYAPAQTLVGAIYLNTDKHKEGHMLLTKASKQGYALAQFVLAGMHIEGKGYMERDRKKGCEMLGELKKQGYKLAIDEYYDKCKTP